MNKSTLTLVVIATLCIGALVGVGVGRITEDAGSATTDGAVPARTATAESVGREDAVSASHDGVPVIRYLEPQGVELRYDEFGDVQPSLSGENFIDGGRPWQHQTMTIEIEGDGAVEYKALMDQGDALSFRWSVDGGQVYYDLHGHDSAFGDEFFTRYDEGEGVEKAGTIIAPYSGQHGWFWLNLEEGPVSVSLEVAGFFSEIIRIDMDSEQ